MLGARPFPRPAGRPAWWYLPLVAAAVAAAVFLPPGVGLGLAAAIPAGVLVLRHPAWGVYGLVLSVPVQREISLAGHGTATQAVMAGLLFAWGAWMALRQRRIHLPPFALALAAYLVVMLASVIVATSVSAALAEIARWLVVLLAFVIIVNTIQTRGQVAGLVACFLIGGAVEAGVGIWQVVTRQVPPSFFVGQGGPPEDLAPRAFGTIGAPNSYAGYLNLTLALALALAVYALAVAGRTLLAELRRRPAARTGLWWLAGAAGLTTLTGLMLLALIVSYSRGGLIGLGCGGLGMAVALGRRAAPALLAIAVSTGLLAALYAAGGLPPSVADRLNSTLSQLQIYDVRGVEPTPDTFNQVERLAHWQAAGNMYLSDPWLGVGIGNFNVVYPQFAVAEWPISRGHAHNYFLHALAETGLAGLLAYLIVFGVALGAGWRAIRQAARAASGLAGAVLVGAFGVVVAFAGHSIFENLHVLNLGIHWAAMIALFYLVPPLLKPPLPAPRAIGPPPAYARVPAWRSL
ncbi:MAG TPA: O-antigen ligase family protein [Chloroflexia bacterium]|nr:O-antigen ligase family protein [Chloroflexia bacterium]